MNSIIVKNKGHIVAEDLMLIGSSTKRGSTNKIGMFGSGWKYALAWFMRNGVDIKIFSGTREIKISTKAVNHRGNDVNVIVVDGKETSLTTDMGPKWTGWMALREVLSNAIDEGQHSVDVKWNPEIYPVDGETQIVIPTNNELAEVMMKYESYFAFNRRTDFVYGYGRIFIKSDRSPMNVYRKGIRCYDDEIHNGYIDIDFYNVSINESRLTSSWEITQECKRIMDTPTLHKEVLLAMLKSGFTSMMPSHPNSHVVSLLKDLYASGYNFHCGAVIALCGVGKVKENSLPVPDKWYDTLVENGIAESIFESGTGNDKFMRTDAFDAKGVEYYLRGVNCKKVVRVGKFGSASREVSVNGDIAFVSEKLKGDDRTTAAKILYEMDVDQLAELLD